MKKTAFPKQLTVTPLDYDVILSVDASSDPDLAPTFYLKLGDDINGSVGLSLTEVKAIAKFFTQAAEAMK